MDHAVVVLLIVAVDTVVFVALLVAKIGTCVRGRKGAGANSSICLVPASPLLLSDGRH
jgi:hypothetical protein